LQHQVERFISLQAGNWVPMKVGLTKLIDKLSQIYRAITEIRIRKV
jgi:hypothetical protein